MLKHRRSTAASQEGQLLCAVCAPPTVSSRELIGSFLATDVNWNKVVQTAFDHSLAPIFCSRLLANFSDQIPPELRHAMQTHLGQHRAKAKQLSTALLGIVDELEKQRIKAIPFKGPTLALRAFKDPTLRLSYDIDILLHDADVERGIACLNDLGYECTGGLNSLEMTAVRRYGGQYHMQHPQTGICVEPHWALTPSTMAIDLDYERLWREAKTQSFQQRTVLALAPEHEALMLCIHAGKERWRSLKPVVDLAGFITENPKLDWDGLIDQARKWGCLRMLLLGLQLVHSVLGVDIKPNLQALIDQDQMVQALSQELTNTLQEGEPLPANPYRLDRYILALRERWSDKLRCILRTTLTPRAKHYDLIRLPNALQWLYVPIKVGLDYVAIPIRDWVRRY